MSKTIDTEELEQVDSQVSSPGYSNAKIAESLRPKRSVSWVKEAKKFIEEVYFWQVDKIKNDAGTYTLAGFEILQDYLSKTGNSEIVQKRGKSVEIPRKPLMSPQDWASSVWVKHRRTPTESVVQESSNLVTNLAIVLATNQFETEEIDVELGEIVDDGSVVREGFETAEETQHLVSALTTTIENNGLTLFDLVAASAESDKQKVKQIYMAKILEGVNEAQVEAAQAVQNRQVTPKVNRKKS